MAAPTRGNRGDVRGHSCRGSRGHPVRRARQGRRMAGARGGRAPAALLRDPDLGAREMIRSLATYPRLDGYRGTPKADVPALEELVLRVSAMAETHPEIVEMDCNPVMVLPRGAVVVDARVRIEPVRSGHDL